MGYQIVDIIIYIVLIALSIVLTRVYYKSEIALMKADSFEAIRELRKEKAEAYNKGFTAGLMIERVQQKTGGDSSRTEVIPVVK